MATKMDPMQIASKSSSYPETGEDDNNGNVSNSITGTVSSFNSRNVNVDQNMICEILSRLPVKSLMQLKCVSKHWCSMILRDRCFIDLHLQQSKSRPCLLITVPRKIENYSSKKSKRTDHDNTFYPLSYFLVTADILLEGGEVSPVVRNIWEINTPSSRIAGPLNGLICLFDPEKNHSVQVCNLSTREVTPWIKSTFISNLNVKDEDRYRLRPSRCDLGFDPVTKVHKVVCFWTIFHHQVCEVLTVGDCKWRTIDYLPAFNFREPLGFGASIHVNGSIYYYCPWMIPCLSKDDKPKFMVAFDVGEEKFRVIGIPDFIRDQIPFRCETFQAVQLLEIDGRPALLSRIRYDIAKMWLFDDDYNNGYRSSTWKEVTIELLPFYWGYPYYAKNEYSVRFHSVLGTDFLIIYLNRCSAFGGGYHYASEVSQYSYNLKKKIFVEMKINGLPPSVPYLSYVSGMSTFAESLSPVQ